MFSPKKTNSKRFSEHDPEHATFDAIKAEFKKKIILPYFDRNKETILQTNASKKGFGAVILQEEQPIYYLPESWMWGSSSCLEHGEIPLFSLC